VNTTFEGHEPTGIATGFCQQAGPLKITLGYATYSHEGLMLFAVENWGANPSQPWRRFWVPRETAVAAAQELCDDAAQYLNMVTTHWRPTEDLDFDDFVEHIRAFVEGSMH